MHALDIAGIFISQHGKTLALTNLTLNKLVYFAQVEALRETPAEPLYTDIIQAWEYGPVEPSIYNAFKSYGRARITQAPKHATSPRATQIVNIVVEKYGWLSAFDLVNYAHRAGGAWSNVFSPQYNKLITPDDILHSSDVTSYPEMNNTFIGAVAATEKQYQNTLRLLGDA